MMFLNNKELRRGVLLLSLSVALLSVIGFFCSFLAGLLVLFTGCITLGTYCVTERYRYQRLNHLSCDLDKLLNSGTPLSIREYKEGELSALASQIQKMTQRLMESADAKDAERKFLADSLADISHQLRTPLTTMNLTAAMLQDPGLSQEKRSILVSEMRGLLRRTQWLVETLLKLSKLDAGTVILQREQVSVRALIQLAAAPIAIPMELRNQTFSSHCDEETFTGDLVWSAEALGNILKNAMEHTPEGGSITVTAEETPLYTKIEVTDSGPGFDNADIPHLFERFYRGKNAAENSCGIGLALARTVIHSQNGTVKAMNTPEGTKFQIKFYKQVV